MIKSYVIDTNILIQAPYACQCFEENRVILPLVVLEELDGLKKAEGEKGANARRAIRFLEKLRRKGDLLKGVQMGNGGILRVETNCVNVELLESLPEDKPDNRILKVCKGIREEEKPVVLVTKDLVLRLKAQILGIEAQDFSTEQVIEEEGQYSGRQICYVAEDKFKEFGVYPPQLSILDVTKGISQIGPYLSIIIPLQIANFLSTMQASESAAMAGDNYPVKRTMILDGVTTVLSSLTGSPFPTTVYYGHPGWKKVGTRSGYSLMMAVVYLSCFFGLPLLILDIIPYEVIIVLLVLVGLNVTSDVVDNMEKEYSGVIFISLFPILAQYIVSAVSDTSVISHAFEVLSYGAFASSLLYSVWLAYIYKKDFKKAGYTAIVLAGLSLIGFIHTETLCWLSKTGKEFGIIYLMIGAICLLVGKMDRE